MDLKIILLAHQNNYVENSSMMSNDAKNLDILAINLNILHNYFERDIQRFFLVTSTCCVWCSFKLRM